MEGQLKPLEKLFNLILNTGNFLEKWNESFFSPFTQIG